MVPRWSHLQQRQHLIEHGPVALREAAVDIIEHGIRAADPYAATVRLVSLDGDFLHVGELEYNLKEWDRIFVIGAGKATQPIALALEEVLGERISDGLVVLKRGEDHRLRRIRIMDAAHPVPDEASFAGAREIVKIAQQARSRDIVFAAITGGSSALLTWPANGITLADKQTLNTVLLECGASIREINAVRKHVSRVKGGLLGQQVFPAELISLTVSDVVGDPVDYITGPTVPDTSTFQDAWRTLDKYGLWDRVPAPVRRHLKRGVEIETPKVYTNRYHTFIVVASDAACRGAAGRCEELGFRTHILTTAMEGESREAAASFVAAATEMAGQAPAGVSCACLASGETTVTLDDHYGEGGPNQEFALSAAFEIAGRENVVVASVGTDGTDGPGAACGGLVDGETISRARTAGLDPEEHLQSHSSRALLEVTGDLVRSGPTGTNVNDVALSLVGR
jgi:glycerate 2-kinase